MKLTATLNGQPCELDLPEVAQVPRLALSQKEAAICMGVSQKTIYRLAAIKEITKTEVGGVYTVSSIKAYLSREDAKSKGKRGNTKG